MTSASLQAAGAETPLHAARLLHLDGWRGLSILCVLIGHFLPNATLNMGRLGVELFFVLSGRLMADILFIQNYPLGSFFRRRISRIFPALFVFVVAMAAAHTLAIAVTGKPGPFRLDGYDVLSSLSFTANYRFGITGTDNVLAHIWSVCVEEHAYLILGLLAWAVRRRPSDVAIILGVAAILCIANGWWQTSAGGDYRHVYWRSDVRGASILMSGCVYLHVQRRPELAAALGGWRPLLLLVAGLALSLTVVPDSLRYSLGTLCFALAVSGLDGAAPALRQRFEGRSIVTLGLMSFSIYLWQQPLFYLTDYHVVPKLLLFALTFVIGAASFHFVEQPARRWLNRNWHGRGAGVVAPARH
jgi:peptidoglycan/LPS O-acetylase OafA/YrhL